MFRQTSNIDSIKHETPTYLNQHTDLESTTCGSIPSQFPSAMCSSLSYTGALLNNPTPKTQGLIQQISQIFQNKNGPIRLEDQSNLLNPGDDSPETTACENSSTNQVTINVFQQQNINITLNTLTTPQDLSSQNTNGNNTYCGQNFYIRNTIPWEKILENTSVSLITSTEEIFKGNYCNQEKFIDNLDQLMGE